MEVKLHYNHCLTDVCVNVMRNKLSSHHGVSCEGGILSESQSTAVFCNLLFSTRFTINRFSEIKLCAYTIVEQIDWHLVSITLVS